MEEDKMLKTKQEKDVPKNTTKEHNPFFSFLAWIFNWVIIPLSIVIIIHMFIFQPYSVSGSSMEPTLENGNYLIISKIDDTFNAITKIFNSRSTQHFKRGGIVVFKAPNTSNIFFIKRIVGLPKERVTIKDGKVTIYNKENPQGIVLHEDYIGNQKTEGDIDQIVDNDSVFVLGDNRKHSGSFDSRYFGPIQIDSIVGNATLRLLPLNEMNLISTPQYNN